ncbi:MAG TPA: secretin N-terminal domain-containing protein, partial [Candidatus Acidoferrales bacterium]|nr:secretin N-terminal domain-containing protein [Candidatus Acidoferrales bacterium]
MRRALLAAAALCASLARGAALGATPALISLDVRDGSVADVIALLADESGRNIVTDDSVKSERITLHLQGVTFEQALAAIVHSRALGVRSEGGILIVGAPQAVDGTADTIVLPLAHAAAEDVAKAIAGSLPAGAGVFADKRTASLVVSGDAQTLLRVRRLVASLDIAAPDSRAPDAARAYRLRFLRPQDVVTKLRAMVTGGNFLADDEQNAVVVSGDEHVQALTASLIDTLDRASPQVLFEVKVADVTPIDDSSDVGIEFGGTDLQGNPLNGSATYAFTGGTVPVYVRLNALVSSGRASILATP